MVHLYSNEKSCRILKKTKLLTCQQKTKLLKGLTSRNIKLIWKLIQTVQLFFFILFNINPVFLQNKVYCQLDQKILSKITCSSHCYTICYFYILQYRSVSYFFVISFNKNCSETRNKNLGEWSLWKRYFEKNIMRLSVKLYKKNF